MADENYRELPADVSYDEWLEFVFRHAGMSRDIDDVEELYWDEESHPERALELITQFFGEPGIALERFSPQDIDYGLRFLMSMGESCYMWLPFNPGVSWPDSKAFLNSIVNLYRDVFAPVYGDMLGHLNTSSTWLESNHACYMWWDVCPIRLDMPSPHADKINETLFHVWRTVLLFDSEACLESVLHGLSENYYTCEREIEALGREFLNRDDISDELRTYGEKAMVGGVI